MRISRWLVAAAILAAAECAAVVAVEIATTSAAQAQFFDDRYYQRRQRPPRSGGFFQNLFGGFSARPFERDNESQQERHVDYSRAPAPVRKSEAKGAPPAPEPTTTIMVMGDAMAGWLAYGLETAFADAPEISVVRKDKLYSGLFRYEPKGDIEWWEGARDILTKEKADYVVMMLGVSDRQNIRERDLDKETEAEEKAAADKKSKDDKNGGDKGDKKAQDQKQPTIVAPEPKKISNGVIEFRTDRWAEVYSRRIDKTIAALKSKGVPVFWVGLPPVYGTKSMADMSYLNDLYRARAAKAGIVYIDVWDGFVDEAGKFASFGPDYEGQPRRLRSPDGVYFTTYGARKLAHYVEREIRRYMNNRALPVSLPTGPLGPQPNANKSAVRPLAGPVVPLTVAPANVDELAGGAGAHASAGDAVATQVLVKGEPIAPPPGRADNFAWSATGDVQQGNNPPAAAPAPGSSSAAPVTAQPAPTAAVAPVAPPAAKPGAKKPAEAKKPAVEKTVQTEAKPKPPADVRPRPPANVQRQQQRRTPSFFSNGPFGWIR